MTENPNAFKHWIDEAAVIRIADAIASTGPFDRTAFVRDCVAHLPALELKDRVRLIGDTLKRCLPDDYPANLVRIVAALPPTTQTGDAFDLWPYCHYVEKYGLDHPDLSLAAMLELTQRFTSEFAVRPYLVRHRDLVLARFAEWTSHPSHHVRRWVSEGTRPRLPWGMRLQSFVDDPTPVLGLLEALKDDPEEYVRRSVANNLNDIAKDHPALVVDVCRRWRQTANADGERMIRHALRTLVKNGDPDALALLGFAPARVSVRELRIHTPVVRVGEALRFSVELSSDADDPQELLIDYAVHHVRANGSTSPKVFKWTTRRLAPGGALTLERAHSMKAVTTRRYYPGEHSIEVLINGESGGTATFTLALAESPAGPND